MNRPGIAIAVFAVALAVTARGAPSQTAAEPAPATFDSLSGPDVFRLACAPCHGPDARGGGPVASALKVKPANLTEIARRNRGVFAKARIAAFVTNGNGGASAAHGSAEMPIWGPTFWSLDPSEVRLRVRIGNIVDFIETLQTETTLASGKLLHPPAAGGPFRVGGLSLDVAAGTEFHRWMLGGVDRVATVKLLRQGGAPSGASSVRVLSGRHENFGPVTLRTEDAAIARKLTFYEKDAVTKLVIEWK